MNGSNNSTLRAPCPAYAGYLEHLVQRNMRDPMGAGIQMGTLVSGGGPRKAALPNVPRPKPLKHGRVLPFRRRDRRVGP